MQPNEPGSPADARAANARVLARPAVPGAAAVDAVVVGSGPNGLGAAITLARAGRSVLVLEAEPTVGGGTRTAELTLPGYRHDVCSSIQPMARSSPLFRQLPLERLGVRWLEPEIQLAHPLDDGSAALVFRDVGETARALGPDARAYEGLLGPIVRAWPSLVGDVLAPLHVPLDPRRAVAFARFGLHALQPTTLLARRFRTPAARAILAGCSAHSMLRLNEPASGAGALSLLASAHAVGWPIVEGGSQVLADALAACLVELGGRIETGVRVGAIDELPPHRAALLDLVPRGVLAVAGDRIRAGRLGGWYAGQLERYRYAPGVFKLDLALDAPVPWRNADVARAVTVHVGGTLEEIAAGEAAVRRGRIPERPFVLLAQQTVIDPSRAPAGGHTVWAYCHVPNGSSVDMTEPILRQVERFAPGVRERIVGMRASGPADLERHDANVVGGDILGGIQDIGQLFTRPWPRPDPYSSPDPSLFVCSSSTPPGGGVHGMCGYHAARSALRGALR